MPVPRRQSLFLLIALALHIAAIVGLLASDAQQDKKTYDQIFDTFGKECLANNRFYNPRSKEGNIRPWSYRQDSYRHHANLSICSSVGSLMGSVSQGAREPSELGNYTVFQPYGCAFHWYSSDQICSILSKFASIHFIGDSITRHTYQIMTMLAVNDLITGAVPKGSDASLFKNCRCDGQIGEAIACRRVSQSMYMMHSSHGYGMCNYSSLPPFQMNFLGMDPFGNTDSGAVRRGLCRNDTRPRIVIANVGLQLESRLNATSGAMYYSHLIRFYTEQIKECSRQLGVKRIQLYFIVYASEPFHNSVSQKYPRQDDDTVFAYNEGVRAFVDKQNATNILYLNSTAIIRNGDYIDGCHPISESVSIRNMYFLHAMDLIASQGRER